MKGEEGDEMNIVHAPTNIAGQMGYLCSGLREFGFDAVGYNWAHTYINYQQDLIHTDAYELAKLVDPLLDWFDLFHFHNGNTMMTNHQDLPLFESAGKRLVMHHWGGDARSMRLSHQLSPYPLPPGYMDDLAIADRLKLLSKYIKHAIVQDVELLPHISDYYEQVHILPLCCNVDAFHPVYPTAKPSIRIVHAPTNRAFKGSAYIEQTVKDLSSRFSFEYIVIENCSHSEAVQQYQQADLIIDQVLSGTYGMLAVEAMAMGKPVIGYLREDVQEGFPIKPPILNANPDTLYGVLSEVLLYPEELETIGRASRSYVERIHGIRPVISSLLEIYNKMA